jgi:ABC-type multidrug transport system ATPase subunit
MTGENIIHVKDLIVRRGQVTVLDISDFKVARGRILALIGPNGSGKSTLLLTLAGLLRPTSGQLFFQGMPVIDRPPPDALEAVRFDVAEPP